MDSSSSTTQQSFDDLLSARLSADGPDILGGRLKPGETLMKRLYPRIDAQPLPGESSRLRHEGRIEHPFNFETAEMLLEINPYHSACQDTLTSALCGDGLGVIDEERWAEQQEEAKRKPDPGMEAVEAPKLPPIDHQRTLELYDKLNSLTEHGFDSLVTQIVQQYWSIGTSYLEVVRDRVDDSAPITGLYWQDTQDIYRHQLSRRRSEYAFKLMDMHSGLGGDGFDTAFAPFGQLARVMGAKSSELYLAPDDELTELVDFLNPTSRWEGYGAPHWLAATSYMEVDRKAMQRVSDYMFNRGTPDSLLMLGGFPMTKTQRNGLESNLSSHGGTKVGGSTLLYVQSAMKDQVVAQVLRLGTEVDGNSFLSMHQTVNLSVASANRVPPVIAGITVPGKLGAANEQVQALMMMQASVINPAQRYIAFRLNNTLFRKIGGVEGFGGTKVRFRTWAESMDNAALNTVARQREQVAASPKRDPKDGLKRG